MAEALVASARLTFTYVVSGVQHVLHTYVDRGTDVDGFPSLVGRDTVLIPAATAAQYLWSLIMSTMPTVMTGPSCLLEERSGIVWTPVAGVSITGDGTMTEFYPASMLTIVLRDTAFKHIRFDLMEPAYAYVGHSNDGLGMAVGITALVEALNGTDADISAPYMWLKSRGDRYLLTGATVAGATIDLNDKLKRRRSLE